VYDTKGKELLRKQRCVRQVSDIRGLGWGKCKCVGVEDRGACWFDGAISGRKGRGGGVTYLAGEAGLARGRLRRGHGGGGAARAGGRVRANLDGGHRRRGCRCHGKHRACACVVCNVGCRENNAIWPFLSVVLTSCEGRWVAGRVGRQPKLRGVSAGMILGGGRRGVLDIQARDQERHLALFERLQLSSPNRSTHAPWHAPYREHCGTHTTAQFAPGNSVRLQKAMAAATTAAAAVSTVTGMKSGFLVGTRRSGGGGKHNGGVRGMVRPRTVRCAAAGDNSATSSTTSTSSANRASIAAAVVGAVLKFPPLWEMASKSAKNMMIKRSGDMGYDWDAEVAALQARAGGSLLLNNPLEYTVLSEASTRRYLAIEPPPTPQSRELNILLAIFWQSFGSAPSVFCYNTFNNVQRCRCNNAHSPLLLSLGAPGRRAPRTGTPP
jgi:hypothetical protein